jgi:hypothetical protein
VAKPRDAHIVCLCTSRKFDIELMSTHQSSCACGTQPNACAAATNFEACRVVRIYIEITVARDGNGLT